MEGGGWSVEGEKEVGWSQNIKCHEVGGWKLECGGWRVECGGWRVVCRSRANSYQAKFCCSFVSHKEAFWQPAETQDIIWKNTKLLLAIAATFFWWICKFVSVERSLGYNKPPSNMCCYCRAIKQKYVFCLFEGGGNYWQILIAVIPSQSVLM